MQINVNGHLSLSGVYFDATPKKFPILDDTIALIAPFFADIDLRQSSGQVYHRCHAKASGGLIEQVSQSDGLLELAKQQINTHYSDADFQPSMVCVITWWNVQPFPSFLTAEEVSPARSFHLKLWLGLFIIVAINTLVQI